MIFTGLFFAPSQSLLMHSCHNAGAAATPGDTPTAAPGSSNEEELKKRAREAAARIAAQTRASVRLPARKEDQCLPCLQPSDDTVGSTPFTPVVPCPAGDLRRCQHQRPASCPSNHADSPVLPGQHRAPNRRPAHPPGQLLCSWRAATAGAGTAAHPHLVRAHHHCRATSHLHPPRLAVTATWQRALMQCVSVMCDHTSFRCKNVSMQGERRAVTYAVNRV